MHGSIWSFSLSYEGSELAAATPGNAETLISTSQPQLSDNMRHFPTLGTNTHPPPPPSSDNKLLSGPFFLQIIQIVFIWGSIICSSLLNNIVIGLE